MDVRALSCVLALSITTNALRLRILHAYSCSRCAAVVLCISTQLLGCTSLLAHCARTRAILCLPLCTRHV